MQEHRLVEGNLPLHGTYAQKQKRANDLVVQFQDIVATLESGTGIPTCMVLQRMEMKFSEASFIVDGTCLIYAPLIFWSWPTTHALFYSMSQQATLDLGKRRKSLPFPRRLLQRESV